jgi:ribosomal protein S18 acetylase RimI-like enzyme
MLLVCRSEGQTVGFVSFGKTREGDTDQARVGELYSIHVLPAFWRRGCGRRLWERARKELKRVGFNEATLWVLEANVHAREFYQRQGFHLDPNASKEAHVGGVNLPEVRYSLRLHG